jgi:hypothetical protein
MQYTVGDYVMTTSTLPTTAWSALPAQPPRGDVGGLGFGRGPINREANKIGWAYQPTGKVVPLTYGAEVYHSEAAALATRVTDAKVRVLNNYAPPAVGGGVGGSNAIADAYVPPNVASLYKFQYSAEQSVGQVASYIARD